MSLRPARIWILLDLHSTFHILYVTIQQLLETSGEAKKVTQSSRCHHGHQDFVFKDMAQQDFK